MHLLAALDVRCPRCEQPPGERCRTLASNRITDTHSGRYWQLDFELKQAWLTRRVQVLRERDGGTT